MADRNQTPEVDRLLAAPDGRRSKPRTRDAGLCRQCRMTIWVEEDETHPGVVCQRCVDLAEYGPAGKPVRRKPEVLPMVDPESEKLSPGGHAVYRCKRCRLVEFPRPDQTCLECFTAPYRPRRTGNYGLDMRSRPRGTDHRQEADSVRKQGRCTRRPMTKWEVPARAVDMDVEGILLEAYHWSPERERGEPCPICKDNLDHDSEIPTTCLGCLRTNRKIDKTMRKFDPPIGEVPPFEHPSLTRKSATQVPALRTQIEAINNDLDAVPIRSPKSWRLLSPGDPDFDAIASKWLRNDGRDRGQNSRFCYIRHPTADGRTEIIRKLLAPLFAEKERLLMTIAEMPSRHKLLDAKQKLLAVIRELEEPSNPPRKRKQTDATWEANKEARVWADYMWHRRRSIDPGTMKDIAERCKCDESYVSTLLSDLESERHTDERASRRLLPSLN